MQPQSGLDLEQWENISSEYHLTIYNIQGLKPGDKIDVLILDRNVMDIVCDINEADVLYPPNEFFRQNRHTYTHGEGLQGILHLHYGNTEEDTILVDFEFDLLTEEGVWLPLKDEKLGDNHWSSFPATTKVGWRGPMVKWDDVDKIGSIYYTN